MEMRKQGEFDYVFVEGINIRTEPILSTAILPSHAYWMKDMTDCYINRCIEEKEKKLVDYKKMEENMEIAEYWLVITLPDSEEYDFDKEFSDDDVNENNSVIKSSSSAKAAIQFLISPGGKIPISERKRPELPPSSPTVTTAVILLVKRLMPFSSIESPVPPPIATTLAPLFNLLLRYNRSRRLFPLDGSMSIIERVVFFFSSGA